MSTIDNPSGINSKFGENAVNKYLATLELPLPPLDEQRRIVARIEEFAQRVAEINQRRSQMEDYAHKLVPMQASAKTRH